MLENLNSVTFYLYLLMIADFGMHAADQLVQALACKQELEEVVNPYF